MDEGQIRRLRRSDMDDLMEIERLSFSVPWSRESFLQEIDNRCARYLVLEVDGHVRAYAGTWLVIDEGHITNIAVHPEARGRGYGERLTRALMRVSASLGITWMTLEVRRSNQSAQALYRKLGFTDVGYRKRYYADNDEDALIMICESMPEYGEADEAMAPFDSM